MNKQTQSKSTRSFSKFRLSSLSLSLSSTSSGPSADKQLEITAHEDDDVDTVISDDESFSSKMQNMREDVPLLTVYVDQADKHEPELLQSGGQNKKSFISVDRSLKLHEKEVQQAQAISTRDYHSSQFFEDLSSLDLYKGPQIPIDNVEDDDCQAKTVRFHKVDIREYPVTVGDNGSVLQGPPVALGWQHLSQRSVDLDFYEQVRGPHRRQKREMVLSSGLRFQLLRDWGHSRTEIQAGTKVANISRKQRNETNARIKEDIKDEKREERIRKLKNLATMGTFQRKERAYLKKHVPGSTSGVRFIDETVHTI